MPRLTAFEDQAIRIDKLAIPEPKKTSFRLSEFISDADIREIQMSQRLAGAEDSAQLLAHLDLIYQGMSRPKPQHEFELVDLKNLLLTEFDADRLNLERWMTYFVHLRQLYGPELDLQMNEQLSILRNSGRERIAGLRGTSGAAFQLASLITRFCCVFPITGDAERESGKELMNTLISAVYHFTSAYTESIFLANAKLITNKPVEISDKFLRECKQSIPLYRSINDSVSIATLVSNLAIIFADDVELTVDGIVLRYRSSADQEESQQLPPAQRSF